MADTARDVIARALRDDFGPFGPRAPGVYAASLIDALHTAGYRILAPGELDGETVERCAEVVEANDEITNLKTGRRHLEARTEGNLIGLAYATAIRSLKGGRNA